MRSRRIKYAVATVVVLLLCRSAMMVPVFRDELQRYLGIGDALFGFLLSLQTGAGVITVLAGGALVDRWGPRRVLRIALIGAAIALGGLAVSSGDWRFVAAALAVYGLSIRPLGIAANTYLIKLFPQNRRRAVSLNLAGTSVGELFFPAVAEGLLHLAHTLPALAFATVFHTPFGVIAIFVLAGSFIYRAGPQSELQGEGGRPNWQWRDMLVPAPLVWIIVLMVSHALADVSLHVWMPRFLASRAFDRVIIGPGYVLSGYAAAYVVIRLILGFLPEDFGRRAIMALPGILGGAAVITGILTGNYMATAGGYVLGAFLWSAEFPAMMSILAHQRPEQFGAAMALQQLLSSGASLIVLNGMGILIARLPEPQMWKAMLVPACIFPCISIGAVLWLMRYGSTLRPVSKQSGDE